MPVHLMLQKKGGVGKSYISSLFLQYLTDRGKMAIGIDIDPTTPTLSQIKKLQTTRLELLKKQNDGSLLVDKNTFSDLYEQISKGADQNTHFVIDCGASGYHDMVSFLSSSAFIPFLQEQGISVYIHSIIQGGNNLTATIASLGELLVLFPSAPFVMWLNAYRPDLQIEAGTGKPFKETRVYQEYYSRIATVINVPEYGYFSEDSEHMFASQKTIQQILAEGVFPTMRAHVLTKYRDHFWEVLDKAMTDIEAYEFDQLEANK